MNTITIRLLGPGHKDDPIRLDAFVKHLSAIRKALDETYHVIDPGAKEPLRYRIIEISRNSPTQVTLLPEGPHAAEVPSFFVSSIREIQENGSLPKGFRGATLRAYQSMFDMQKKGEIGETRVFADSLETQVSRELSQHVEDILGKKYYSYGSVIGWLEQLNIHSGQNVAVVYSTLGPPRGTPCHFTKDLFQTINDAFDYFVEVSGTLAYNAIDVFPEEVKKIDSLIKLRARGGGDEFLLYEMRGIAPQATGSETSEEFVRRLRDEW